MRRLIFATLFLAAACNKGPGAAGKSVYTMAELPAAWKPAVEKGDDALAELQKGLLPKLTKALAEGSPAQAVAVCQVEAPAMKKAIEASHALELGRTSHKLRNPKAAPRPWAAPHVSAGAGKKAAEVEALVVDLGDKLGLLRPIPVGPVCVTCHGELASLTPTLTATLAQLYPQDQATGFKEGELRGWFWAEVKKP